MDHLDQDLERIASLGDAVRRRLYRFVVERDAPVGRDEAAAGVGVPRHTAKFHLDKLVEEGLLDTEYRRLTDRSGPGAGRPAKLYRRAAGELSVSLPDREYELAGRLLADAFTVAERDGLSVADALRAVSTEAGRALGSEAGTATRPGRAGAVVASLVDALSSCGFEPHLEQGTDGEEVVLRNCPFHGLARSHPELVCGMNLDFLTGVVEGIGAEGGTARLDPAPDRCCVRIDLA